VRIVAVLLAAGGGTRFSGSTHKLLASLDGRPVLQHALEHVVESAVGPVVVVTGAVELDDVLAAALAATGSATGSLTGIAANPVTHVRNPDWFEGQATSIAVATAAADEMGADAVIIGLGDQPFVPAEAWRLVAAASPEHHIVVASYDGRRGPHPVRLHRSLWAALPDTGDDGARTFIREHPALVHVVPCPGSAADIDTQEDLKRWTSS
jgi:molybdenum cofactor cytidylyltransferase